MADPELDNITGASIVIFQGFDASEDVLSFTPQYGVTGAFVGNTLLLTGSATPAQYQTLLRSVRYQNTDVFDPTLQNRIIQFQAYSGGGSNFQTRDISITASLQAAQSLPFCESFETNGHGVRYMAYHFNDGANNFWEQHDASSGKHPSHGETILGATGNYLWVSEDVDAASNPNPLGIGEMLLNPFDIVALDSVSVSVNLAVSDVAPLSWEASDYVFIEYRVDADSWIRIGAFYGDGTTHHLKEDSDLNGEADPTGIALTKTLVPFNYGFWVSGSTLEVRLLHSSDGSEEFGFDDFCVSGFTSTPCAASNTFSPIAMNATFAAAGANQPNTYYWGLSTGYIEANPSGGIGPYTYQWSSKAGYTIKGDTKQRARMWYPTGPQWVKVEITDVGASCTFEDSIYIDWIDFTCNHPFIWYYELCDNTTNTTVCMQGTANMRNAIASGNYSFGPCLVPKSNGSTQIAGIKLYPNPANNVINVASQFDYSSPATLEIVDLNGKLLQTSLVDISEGVFEYSLNVGNLTNGMYMIRLSTDREVIVERFQVLK